MIQFYCYLYVVPALFMFGTYLGSRESSYTPWLWAWIGALLWPLTLPTYFGCQLQQVVERYIRG